MIESIQMYIRSLNFKYRTDLRAKGVVYENAYGQFLSPHRLQVCFQLYSLFIDHLRLFF